MVKTQSQSSESAGTDDTLPSLSMSYTSTEYTLELRGPLEEGYKDMLSGESKRPLASELVLKRHTSPMGDEVLTTIPATSNVPTRKGCVCMVIYTTLSSLE